MMLNAPAVFVYYLTTTLSAVTKGSVEAVTIAILDEWQVNFLSRWLVAVTQEQALQLRGLPLVITQRQRGVMVRNGDQIRVSGSGERRRVERVDRGAPMMIETIISVAQSLSSAVADSSGRASWSWVIGGRTKPGTGTVTVTCSGERISSPITIG
jgi:hypothetical protein